MGVSTDAIVFCGWLLPEYDEVEILEGEKIWEAYDSVAGEYAVDIIKHCSGSYPMWAAAIPGTILRAFRGAPVEFATEHVGDLSDLVKLGLALLPLLPLLGRKRRESRHAGEDEGGHDGLAIVAHVSTEVPTEIADIEARAPPAETDRRRLNVRGLIPVVRLLGHRACSLEVDGVRDRPGDERESTFDGFAAKGERDAEAVVVDRDRAAADLNAITHWSVPA